MAGNRETNDLLSPPQLSPTRGTAEQPVPSRAVPCRAGIAPSRASPVCRAPNGLGTLRDAGSGMRTGMSRAGCSQGWPAIAREDRDRERGLCFPSRLCFPDGPIDEAPCGQTAPDPPQNRAVNLIKWPLPPSHPWSRLSSHQGSVFLPPHSGDKFLNHLITCRLNAADLSPGVYELQMGRASMNYFVSRFI